MAKKILTHTFAARLNGNMLAALAKWGSAIRRWHLGASVILFIWPNPTLAFCLDDEELKYVLQSVYIYSIGQTLGVCARKYPQMKNEAMNVMRSFQSTYEQEIRYVDRKSAGVFERLYPGHGAEARNQNDIAANSEGMKTVEAYSEKECGNSLNGVRILTRLNDWGAVMSAGPVGMTYEAERARVPRCH